jgi:hypothetical protein
MQMQLEQARLAHQQQTDQTASDTSRMFQEGLGQLGYSKPEIQVFAAHPESGTALLQSRLAPYSQSPGETRVVPGVGGAPEARNTAPINEELMGRYLDTQDPTGRLRGAYVRRQAFPPISVTEGGGAVGLTDQNRLGYLVQPDSLGAPTPSPPPPRPTGPSANAPRVPYGDPVAELTQLAGMPPSSGYRTPSHQADLVRQGLTRTRGGAHPRGDGIDFPIPAGPQQQAVAARIRQRYPQARFAFEGTNLHVTLPGWGGAPDVSNSRGRYPMGGASSQTAQHGGRTYYRIHGQWYDNPEGR